MEHQNTSLESASASSMQTTSLINSTTKREIYGLVKAERNLSIDKAIKARKLVHLCHDIGEPAVLKAIAGTLIMASEFFNFSRPFTENQAVQAASLLLDSHGFESLEDVVLCLKYAKTGKYGKTYNRFDGELIFEWFRAYLGEKYERFEQIKHNEKFQHQQNHSETLNHLTPMIAPMLNRIASPGQTTTKSITDKTHFQNFLSLMPLCSTEELTTFRDHFTTENKKHFNSPFTPYINAINNHLSTHPP